MTVYGYARGHVDGAVVAQLGTLHASGCDECVFDVGSSRALRDGWERLVEAVMTGDTIRVTSWSVISGNPAAYRATVYALADRGVRVDALFGTPPF